MSNYVRNRLKIDDEGTQIKEIMEHVTFDEYGVVHYDVSNEIIFETPRNRPEPIVKALSKMFPDVEFRHRWADENLGSNVGEILYLGGEEIEWDIPDAFSKEAYEMAIDIWNQPLSPRESYYYENIKDGSPEPLGPKPSLQDVLKESTQRSKAELGHTVPLSATKDKGEPSL